MTDKTQPEAGSTHIIRYALELGLLWIDGDGRDKVREALDALDDLEAKLASIGAGGVQALSAAPGAVSDTQHSQFLSDVLTAAGLITHGKRCKALGERLSDMVMRLRAAPQQEAQEPYAYAVYFPDQPKVELVHDLDELIDDLTNRPHAVTKLYTTPQPAPVVGRMSPSKEWLETRLAIADDSDVQAGVPSKNARPCDAPPGCNSHNCLECNDYPRAGGVQALSAAPEIHEPKCPALDGAGCTCAKPDPTIDRAWAQFCGGIGDGLDAPYPGMISAFERYYSQSFADKAWRNEASVWAAAWKAALLAASPTPPAEQAAPKAAPGDVLDEALRERDDAEDFIDALLDEVLGHERPEWSSSYGRADALNDVQERMTALHKPAVDKAWDRFQSTKAAPGEPFDECFPGEPRVAVPQGLISAACFAIRNKRDGGKVLEQLRRYSVGDLSQPLAPQQEAQEPGEIPESIERMATGRYKVVPSHESMFHRWAVVAGSGTQQLYLGREVECQNMARKFAGAFLDGAFVAMQSTAPQPAPAPLSDDTALLEALKAMMAQTNSTELAAACDKARAAIAKATGATP